MTREEALKQFMMNQMSDRSEDLGFYLLGEIYDDFESRTCENCKHFSLRDMNGELDDKFGFGYCDKGIRDASKEFGCTTKWEAKTVSTDTKSH